MSLKVDLNRNGGANRRLMDNVLLLIRKQLSNKGAIFSLFDSYLMFKTFYAFNERVLISAVNLVAAQYGNKSK